MDDSEVRQRCLAYIDNGLTTIADDQKIVKALALVKEPQALAVLRSALADDTLKNTLSDDVQDAIYQVVFHYQKLCTDYDAALACLSTKKYHYADFQATAHQLLQKGSG